MIKTNQSNLLKYGDIIIVTLPDHRPKAHEKQGTCLVIIVGIPQALAKLIESFLKFP